MRLPTPLLTFERIQVSRTFMLRHSQDPEVRGISTLYTIFCESWTRKWSSFTLLTQLETQIGQFSAHNFEIVAPDEEIDHPQGRLIIDDDIDANAPLLPSSSSSSSSFSSSSSSSTSSSPFPAPAPPKNFISELKLQKQKVLKQLIANQDQKRLDHLKTLRVQGKICEWYQFCQQDNTYSRMIWGLPPKTLAFALNSDINWLPSNFTSHLWGKTDDPTCPLCKSPPSTSFLQTTQHILAGCKLCLEQGRYTWRHDSIVLSIATWLQKLIDQHWFPDGFQLLFDQTYIPDKQYTFPPHILVTSQRPDILLFNNTLKLCLLIELTAGSEEKMHERHEEKEFRYTQMKMQIAENGWTALGYSIEVCARGFTSRYLKTLLHLLRIPNDLIQSIIIALTRLAVNCSYFIYLQRNKFKWDSSTLPLIINLPLPNFSFHRREADIPFSQNPHHQSPPLSPHQSLSLPSRYPPFKKQSNNLE